MTAERVYLDHNATSPLRPEVRAAMIAALDARNASSIHAEGRQARALVETAREQVAALAGVSPAQVVFTSGGTEANAMALSPAWLAGDGSARLFVSAVEHPSVLKGGQFAAGDVEIVPVDADAVVTLEAIRSRLERWRETSGGAPFMVSVMAANNETGSVQPIPALGAIVREIGGVLHCDAVQAAGKLRLNEITAHADLVSLSAHKFGGPKGAGALILANARLGYARPMLRGGGQERGYRAGTENVAAIAGFGAAAETATRDLPDVERLAGLRDRLEAEIAAVAPEAIILSHGAARLPNTTCFGVAGMNAETLLIAFDLEGVALSAGSACSSGKVERSHVLAAMGAADDVAGAAIRASLGWTSTEADIGRFAAAWSKVYRRFVERRRAA